MKITPTHLIAAWFWLNFTGFAWLNAMGKTGLAWPGAFLVLAFMASAMAGYAGKRDAHP